MTVANVQGPKTLILGNDLQNTAAVDGSGNLCVNVVAGGTGGNASVSSTGSAVPASATAIGWNDGSGNLQIPSAANPLPISGSISATNPSVSTIGSAVPTSATAVGWKDGSGNLQDVSAANPLPITGSISASNPSVGSTGSAVPTSATLLGVKDGSGNLQPVGSANPVRTDPTGTTVQPVSATSLPLPTGAATAAKQPALGTAGTPSADVISVQGVASGTAIPVSGTVAISAGSAVIGHVIADSGSTTAVTSLPAIPSGTNVIGHVIADSGSTTAVTSLPATPAGTNLIGKVGIDQTTPGTTNKVSIGTDGTVAIGTALPAGTNVIGHVITDTGSVTAATLSAETTKVIGTVNVASGQTIAVTNTGTFATQITSSVGSGSTGSAVPSTADYGGLLAQTALPSAATAGNLVGTLSDKFGRQAVVINTIRDLVGTASLDSSSSSAVSFIATGGTGVFTDITELVITNDSATATIVSLTDGTKTYKFAINANGGLTKSFISPLVASSSATAWTILNSAGVSCHYVAVFANNK